MKYCRPPYGILPAHSASACAEVGLTPVGWDVSSRDWLVLTSSQMKIELAARSLRGKVVLFHDGYGDPDATAEVVRWLVPVCKAAGISPATLDRYGAHRAFPGLQSGRAPA